MAKRLTPDELRQRMHQRVDGRTARLHRQIDAGKIGGEEGRLWLDRFAKGQGLDIACGDFLIGGATGIDTNPDTIGPTWLGAGEKLRYIDSESQDFVVSNYLDAFPAPLDALLEWNRVLKKGGVLAIVVANSNKYGGQLGPLKNYRKVSVFTKEIIGYYVTRAGFKVRVCEEEGSSIHVMATKK